MAKAIREGTRGGSKKYAGEVENLAKRATDLYKKRALERTWKTGRERSKQLKELSKTERKAVKERKLSEQMAYEAGKKGRELTPKESAKVFEEQVKQRKSQGKLSASEAREMLLAYDKTINPPKDKIESDITRRKKNLKIRRAKGEIDDVSLKSELAEINKKYQQYLDTVVNPAREAIYVNNPSKFKATSGGIVDPVTNKTASKKLKPEQQQRFNKGLQIFRNMVGIDVLDDKNITVAAISPKSKKAGRSFYRGNTDKVYMGDNADPAVVAHELGHWLQEKDPAINKKIQDFFERRTQGEEWQKLKDLTGNPNYRDDEVAKPDKWMRPYMGKKCHPSNSEILSMGIEHMYRDPIKLAKEDPEFFDFIYNLLRGK